MPCYVQELHLPKVESSLALYQLVVQALSELRE